MRLPAAFKRLSSFLPVGAASRKSAKSSQSAHRTIERHLRKWGLPEQSVAERDGWHYVRVGSANGRVGVIEVKGGSFLHAEAVLMPRLPSDRDLIVPLMRELLEQNVLLPEAAKFGIVNDSVLVVITRPLQDLSPDQIGRAISAVMGVADSLDDGFLKKYGGTSKRRSSQ